IGQHLRRNPAHALAGPREEDCLTGDTKIHPCLPWRSPISRSIVAILGTIVQSEEPTYDADRMAQSTLSGAAIVGIGRTAFTRKSGRTALAMAAEAARAALADAGLGAADVDGFTCYTSGDSAGPMQVAYAIGVEGLGWSVPISGGGNVVATTVANAMA